nr:GNAT family N-acetyltransferase [Brucella intermedia]
MQLRKLRRDDWTWIQTWFQDECLNRALGPLDQEWLNYVLTQHDGIQLIAEIDGEPVGLIGCQWDRQGKQHGITDFAIAPAKRQRGLGGRVLAGVVDWAGHPSTASWVAFVDPQNLGAQKFFSVLGWQYDGIEDGMHRFELIR